MKDRLLERSFFMAYSCEPIPHSAIIIVINYTHMVKHVGSEVKLTVRVANLTDDGYNPLKLMDQPFSAIFYTNRDAIKDVGCSACYVNRVTGHTDIKELDPGKLVNEITAGDNNQKKLIKEDDVTFTVILNTLGWPKGHIWCQLSVFVKDEQNNNPDHPGYRLELINGVSKIELI